MTEHSIESADQNAQNAAGPPPHAEALTRSGLVDQPRSAVKQLLDKVSRFLTGNSAKSESR
jgi:hypothetical protein